MTIEDIANVNFNKNWLTIKRDNSALVVRPKDCGFWRWCKYVVQVLTFGLFRVYGHVRIDKVVNVMGQMFKRETGNKEKKLYLDIANQLLAAKEPITTHRKVLMIFRDRIEKQCKPSVVRTLF